MIICDKSYGSCHPVWRNVKIKHLKTGSVKSRIWRQGVGCKKCLNCEKKNIFCQLYGSYHQALKLKWKLCFPKLAKSKTKILAYIKNFTEKLQVMLRGQNSQTGISLGIVYLRRGACVQGFLFLLIWWGGPGGYRL